MPSLLSLLDKQPSLPDATMSSEGYVLWLAWDGEPDANVTRILQDYGGLDVVRDTGQALWFFFTPDALLALARLTVWGKFNLLSMVVLAMPGVLRAGVGQTLFVSLDAALAGQEVQNPRPGLMIWIHPRVRDTGVNMPGLSFVPSSPEQNMVRAKWTILDADARLPYTSSQGWYAILRPLGNPLDKNFQNGWRNLFAVLETILRQGKWKYSLNDNFLMLPIDSLGQLRNWLRELLLALNRIREDSAQSYWPCVNAIVDRKGLNFNSELPQKVNITWDELMPDYPLVSYRNAYLLGHDFVIHDLYFSDAGTSILDWCTVGLRELSEREGSVPLLMAGQLVKGREHCFYCGARSHASGQCPSRVLPPLPGDFWRRYSDLDLDAINAAYRAIEQTLARSGTEGLRGLPGTGSPEGRVLEGLFALKNSVQLRSVERIWSLTGKDIHAESSTRGLAGDSSAWNMVERLQRAAPNDLGSVEKELLAFLAQTPRDWRLHSLLGFVAMERGESAQAHQYWQEAENLSSVTLHQAWHQFLRAHLLELMGRLPEAIEVYEMVRRLLPQWAEAEYRHVVCRVKMGFAEQAAGILVQMVIEDPTLFNRILLDPDLERGRQPILTALFPLWVEGQKNTQVEGREIERLSKHLDSWFPPEHPVSLKFSGQLRALRQESVTRNYMVFQDVGAARPAIEEELEKHIRREIETLQARFKQFLSRLEIIRDEASWFPFPRALVEFNKEFNEAANILNQTFTADFHDPVAFKLAHSRVEPLGGLLARLQKRLKALRLVRDATLFGLLLSKTFVWMEIVSLILATAAVVVLLFFGGSMGMEWLSRTIKVNFWELQKVIVMLVSLAALGVAALRTTLIFEKRRDKMLAEARLQREEMQRERLEKARARRAAVKKSGRGEEGKNASAQEKISF